LTSILKDINSRLVGLFRKRDNQSPGKEKSKELNEIAVSYAQVLKSFFLIVVGIVFAGFGLKGFLLPNSFIDGGVTGISLLAAEITKFPLSILLIIINLPFLILAFHQVSKPFAVKSILAIVGLALAVYFINYPVITSDKLLVSVFGGFFLGAGIGLAVRGGAVLDGTEVLAIFLNKKTGFSIGDIILIFNIIIFSFAAYILSIEIALYAILTYIAASKTVDFVIQGIEEYTGVTIISDYNEKIRVMLIEKLGYGVTIYSGKKGYAKENQELKGTDIIYTVITRLEIARLQNEVEKIDPNAFIVMNSLKDTKGGIIRRRMK
jgi:uncharacterized membrane-anchored protein YitT (DUF2179 family)